MVTKERRRKAVAERRLSQKACKFLNKKIEKIQVAIEEECKEIQENLLKEYKDVFAEKLTSKHRINCTPVKLELVKNSDQL